MSDIVEKVKDEVYKICRSKNNTCGIGAWTHHILTVYKIATSLCSEYEADCEVVALAALLHDVASVTDVKYLDNHHVVGAEIAEEMLVRLGYDKQKTKLVKRCILNHRGSVPSDKTSNEEICVADADALAHFYNIPSLFSMVYKSKGMDIDDGAEFILNKLERSYNKLSDIGKKYAANHYKSARLLLVKVDT
ncbi:MAG: HD domain-containing protein [Candidatus Nanosyncoccaceae bacterium]